MKPDEKEWNLHQRPIFSYDPIVWIRDVMRKWVLIAVVALIVGLAACVYTQSSYVPRYSTSATLALTNRDGGYHDLDAAFRRAKAFSEVLNSSVMRSRILEELGLEAFDGDIQAEVIQQTNLLTVRVTAGDPETAYQAIRVLLEQHDAVTCAVMGEVSLEVLEMPAVPGDPTNQADLAGTFRKGFGLAFAGMLVLLAVLAYFKDVVRSEEEAVEKLSCRCLGALCHERNRNLLSRKRPGIRITDPQTGLRYGAAMDKLARRVEKNMGKVLMVTGVTQKEGSSTVAANLALALAPKYARVLLIDGDLRQPACQQLLAQQMPEFFIQNVLAGETALEEAVRTDACTGLKMLFAKQSSGEDAAKLLHSGEMARLLEQARERYDCVIIDLPPMSCAPDAEVMTELADACLLVVRQNSVCTAELNRALDDLQRGRAKLLGCVLNNVFATRIFSGAGYGKYKKYAARVSRHTEA